MPRELVALQRLAGNHAVSGLVTKSRFLTPIPAPTNGHLPGSEVAATQPIARTTAAPAPVASAATVPVPPAIQRRPASPVQRRAAAVPTVQRDEPKQGSKPATGGGKAGDKAGGKKEEDPKPEELYVFAPSVDIAARTLGQVTQQLKDKSNNALDVVIIGLDPKFVRLYDRTGAPISGPVPLELPKEMRFDPGIYVIPPGGGPSRRLRLDPKSGRVGIYEVAGVLVDKDPKKAKAAAASAPATGGGGGHGESLEDVGKSGAEAAGSGPTAFDLRKYMKDTSALDAAAKGHEKAGQFFVVPHPVQGGGGTGKGGGARTSGFAGELEGKGPPPNAPPWPVSMDGPKLQPADSEGIFSARINWGANGNNDTASQVISAVGSYIHYRWEVFDVTQFAKRQAAAVAKQARQTQAVIKAAGDRNLAPPEAGGSGATKPGGGGGATDGPVTASDKVPAQVAPQDPDANALDDAIASRTTAKAGAGTDPTAATRNRKFRRGFEELWDDTARSGKDLVRPSGSTLAERQSNAQANLLAIELLPVSFVITSLGSTLRWFADLFAGETSDQEINFDHEGVFLVRVITTPSATTDRDGKDVIRPSSVASRVVEVVSMDRMLKEGLDEPGAQLTEADKALAEANASGDKDRIAEATEAKTLKELEVGGDPVAFLEMKIQIRGRDLERAHKKWDGIAVGPILAIERDLEILRERLGVYKLQNERRGDSWTLLPPQRVTATLVSEVTGQTYPLMLSVGPMKDDDGRKVWKLMDATGQDAEGFTGYGATEYDAIVDSFRQFGNKAGYGRGKIAVRLPKSLTPNGAGPGREFQLDSKPLGWAVAKARLDDLVMTLAAIGLFVTTAGTASMVIGAAVAAARLIDRLHNGTLRFDAAAVSDVLAVLGAAGAAGQAIGGMRVASAGVRFEKVGKDMAVMLEEGATVATADLAKAAKAMDTAASVLKGIEMANEVMNYAGVIWGNVTFFNEMLEVAALENQGPPGGITHAEARRRRAAGIAGAINNNAMAIAPNAIKARQARKKAGKTGAPSETPAPATEPTTKVEPKAGSGEPGAPHEGPGPKEPATPKEGTAPDAATAPKEGATKPSEPSATPKETVPGAHPAPGEAGHGGGAATTAAGSAKGTGPGTAAPKPPKKGSAKERSAAHKALHEAARGGTEADLSAAARDAIGKGGSWKDGLKKALGKLEGKHRENAEKALVKARDDIVNEAWKKVQEGDPRFKDLDLENTGTKSFSSDIDATVRPKKEAQQTGHELSQQVELAAEAAQKLSDELRGKVGGETDAVIDTNIYSFIGEGRVKPSPGDAAGKGAQTHVDLMVGLAEQMRGQSNAEFKAFEKRLTEKVGDPRVQQEVKRIIGQAREFNQARQGEWKAAVAEAKSKAPNEPKAVQERIARDQILAAKKQELAGLLKTDAPNHDAIARKQSEINWFAPDAYATPSAFKQAVAHGQRLKGTAKSTAEWTGQDVAAKLRESAGKLKPDDPRAQQLKREASLAESQQSTLTEIEKDLKRAQENAPVDQAAVKELEAQANGLRKAIAKAAERVAIAEILDLTTPSDQPGPERISQAAAASASNTGMMEGHVKAAKDIDGKVKAAAKYAGRVAMAEMLSGLRPATDPVARLIGEFVKSRWGILENVSPQIMRDLFVRYARLTGRHTELAYNARGEATGATDALKQAFVNDVLNWGRGTNQELQGAALTSKAFDNPTPAPPPPSAGEPVAKGTPPLEPAKPPTAGKHAEGGGEKQAPSGSHEESPAATPEQPKPSAPRVITGAGGVTRPSETPLLNPPGLHKPFEFRLKSLSEGDSLLQRLANGDPAALTEQGVSLPKGYKTQGREFGLAQLPDGSFAIIQGEPGSVAWDGLPPGTIPLAHTHPITPERALNSPGTVREILSHLGKRDHWDDATPRAHDAAHIAPSGEDVLFCAANKVVNHDVHTGYVHTGDGVLKTPTGAPNERAVSFNIAEAKHIGNIEGAPVVEAALVAHDVDGNVLYIGRIWAANFGGHVTISMDPIKPKGPADPNTLKPMHGAAPAAAADSGGPAGPTAAPAPANKAGGTGLPEGMRPAGKTGAGTVTGSQAGKLAGGTVVEKDDFATTVRSRQDPKALVRLETDGTNLRLTDIFRRDLPPGSGVTLLAEALRAVHAGPGFELMIHGIINEETVAAHKAEQDPRESKLGKTALRALESIGLSAHNVRWEIVRGKLCIIMDIN